MLAKSALGVCVSLVLVAAACSGSKGATGGGNTGGAATGGTGSGNGTATGGSTGTGGTTTTSSSGASTSSSSGASSGATSSSGKTSSSSSSTSTSSSTSSSTSAGSAPTASGCPVVTATSPWNVDISGVTVNAADQAYLATMNTGTHLHPDFGSVYGIPYQYVNNAVTKSPVTFQYASESDVGPYPIPANPIIEQGSDAHLLMIQTDECKIYELYGTSKVGTAWHAGSGAIWGMKTNSTRTACWTSADAAGLPIFPGLARYEEAKAGAIHHALRFTMNSVQQAFTPPASHFAGTKTATNLPPFGLHLRLKASVNIGAATPQAKIVLTALHKYGMFLADIGSDWFIGGSPDPSWNDADLNYLKGLTGSDFEVLPHGALTTPAGCP